MDTQETRALLLASLERWQLKSHTAENDDAGAAGIAVSLRHIEVFALATIAGELHELRLQAQGADEHPSPADSATTPMPLIDRRRQDDPCRETHTQKGGTQTYRCTRRQGHAGDHVDAAGTRWDGEGE